MTHISTACRPKTSHTLTSQKVLPQLFRELDRVLGDEAAFDDFLCTLAYPCIEETANPVVGLFLMN